MESTTSVNISEIIGHRFTDVSLLEEAFRHSSYVNEQNDKMLKSNERLEFLGDAVLNLVIGHLLMLRYPQVNEGKLSKMRASLVNESRLAEISRDIHLGEFIQLGKGEMMSDGSNKPSILADALEALIAAVYLDGGYRVAFELVERLFVDTFAYIDEINPNIDYKSRLQEFVQLHQISMPEYTIIRETGPDHDKTFTAELVFNDITAAGSGKSKKGAEQEAAKNAYKALKASLQKR
ncbi:MAG: ribonuclease III [Desulfobacterales bacterium]